MTSVVALPDPMQLELVDVEADKSVNLITAFAVAASVETRCPLCQQASARVHSYYTLT